MSLTVTLFSSVIVVTSCGIPFSENVDKFQCYLAASASSIKPPYAVYFQGGLTWYNAKTGILLSLQKLSLEGYIRVHYSTEGIQVSFLKHADALSADIDQAVLDLMNLCMKDFTEEEKKMAEDLNRRVYLNLRRSLEEYEQ